MGVLVNAYLCFGVQLGWEQVEQLPWDTSGIEEDEQRLEEAYGGEELGHEPRPSFESWRDQLSGLVDPWNGTDEEWEAWYATRANAEAKRKHWAAQRELEKNFPIQQIVIGDDSCVIVAVNSSVSIGYWGEPREAIVAVSDENLQETQRFCAEHGIPFEEPKWLIVSEYAG